MYKQKSTTALMEYLDRKKRLVLIADDEPVNQMILSEMLSSTYELLIASDGKEALSLIAEHARELSMVLLDVMMPVVSGLDVLKAMRENPAFRDIPVIILTSQTDVEVEALNMGASDFLVKPYGNPRAILARISNIIRMNESARVLAADLYDNLTELLSMRHFLELTSVVRRQNRARKLPSGRYIFFNLIKFKLYNVTYGLERGDEILKKVADLLKHQFPDAYISRFTADHFVVYTEADHSEEDISELISDVHGLDPNFSLQIKAGIYEAGDTEIRSSAACDLAKMACDSIKTDAAEHIRVYDESLDADSKLKKYIGDHLEYAIAHGHIKVYYQPVVRSISGNLCGMEALVRWIDPERGFMSPGEFIPVLEEERLIHKLDICVIQQICREYRHNIDRGIPVVPVSFNLSRMDFMLTDIGAAIDQAVEEYMVPRDMLNIEITESMFVRDASRISREIERFHGKGYKVWMDDFGSGYSSLNILKDYDFDEVKIDMAFLSTFNDRSKSILRSTVRMAKDINIQTLAEGVETREQYEFLRSIGCEKLQGYYFGKPQPYNESLQHCFDQGLHIETRAWAAYNDKVGRVNFLTDKSMAILEDNGRQLHFLFANDAYLQTVRSNGTESIEESEAIMNDPDTPMQAMFRSFADSVVRSGKSGEITYPSGEQYMQVKATLLARCNGHNLFTVNLTNVTRNLNEEEQERLDGIIRNTLYLYDVATLLDFDHDRIEYFDLMKGESEMTRNRKHFPLREHTSQYIEEMIFPDDREHFAAFVDHSSIRERIRENGGYIADYFRVKQSDGNYKWSVVTVLSVSGHDSSRYIGLSQKAAIDSPEIWNRLLATTEQDYRIEHDAERLAEGDTLTGGLLWKNIRDYSNIHYFWKDTNRRFVGVSKSFLDYYGLESEADVIGKTDEDMHWHVSDGPFRDDEERIIAKGERTMDVAGKCLIRGVLHNIIASKMPLYRDGKIVGLIGYFVDAEQMNQRRHSAMRVATVDLVTGVANPRGIMESLMNYIEEFRLNGMDFAVINMHVQGYEMFRDDYGDAAGNELLRALVEIMLKEFGTEAAIGHLLGSHFIALYKNPDPMKMNIIMTRIRQAIRNLTSVGDRTCTCFPNMSVFYASGTESFDQLIAAVLKTGHPRDVKENLDPLTKLLNRQGIDECMEEYMLLNPEKPGVLLAIDIDNFKLINDLFGHATGDAALRDLADTLTESFADSAIVGRNGGDEFLVFVGDTTYERLEPDIQTFIRKRYKLLSEGRKYYFTISAGLVEYPRQATRIRDLCRMADAALYSVKVNSKHGYQLYNEELKEENRSQLGFTVSDLATGIPGALVVYRANDDEKILFANTAVVKLFECEDLQEFMDYVQSSFHFMVHPEDIDATESLIWQQIREKQNLLDGEDRFCDDNVTYRIVTKTGKIKYVQDFGRLVHSSYYGDIFYAFIHDMNDTGIHLELMGEK